MYVHIRYVCKPFSCCIIQILYRLVVLKLALL